MILKRIRSKSGADLLDECPGGTVPGADPHQRWIQCEFCPPALPLLPQLSRPREWERQRETERERERWRKRRRERWRERMRESLRNKDREREMEREIGRWRERQREREREREAMAGVY